MSRRAIGLRGLACGVLLTGLACDLVQAQQLPDAGALLRQLQPQTSPALPAPQAPAPAAPAPRSAVTARVHVTGFRFEGNRLIAGAELERVVARYRGRDLTPEDLGHLSDDVARRYRKAGRLARVIVPAQKLENGVLRVTVVEARTGRTRFSADTRVQDLHVAPERILATVNARRQDGGPVYVPDFARGVLLASDLAGIAVSGREVAGTGTGETDIELTVHDTPIFTGDLTVDNFGQAATGSERAVGRFDWNSAFGFGERLEALGELTPHLQYYRVAAALPLSADGLRLIVNASGLNYQIETPRYSWLGARGSSNNFGADLGYPLIRAVDRNLSIGAGIGRISPFNTDVLGVVSDYHIYEFTVHATGNLYDAFHGGAVSVASLAVGNGWLRLDGSPNEQADELTARTRGHFVTVRYSLERTQALGGDFSLYAAVSGQYGSRNLDSAEQIYLSGPYGVTAYPVSDNAGTDGQLGVVELRWAGLKSRWCRCALKVRYDVGHLTVFADPHFPGAPPPNSWNVQSAGVSLYGEGPRGTHFSILAARRVGGDAGREAPQYYLTGAAQDARVWASLGWTF